MPPLAIIPPLLAMPPLAALLTVLCDAPAPPTPLLLGELAWIPDVDGSSSPQAAVITSTAAHMHTTCPYRFIIRPSTGTLTNCLHYRE
jgi:hypothetical protein